MEAEEQEFELMHDKALAYEVTRVCWAQNMDLLALVTTENVLELVRISFKSHKVFQVEEKEPITTLTFSPDCNAYGYGSAAAGLRLPRRLHQDAENGER